MMRLAFSALTLTTLLLTACGSVQTPGATDTAIASTQALPVESQTVTSPDRAFGNLSAQIVYGTVSSVSRRPYQVSVTPQSELSGGWCGGTLLSSGWVLTAAHCVEGQSTSTMRVRAGINNLTRSEGQQRGASQIILYPGRSSSSDAYDIALIKLSSAFILGNTVQPAALPGNAAETTLDMNGKMAVVSGWGLTENDTYSNTALREVMIPITPTGSDCGSRPGNTICGKYSGGKDSCNGDSGGPLAAPLNGKTYVLGVVSYGPSECRGYGVYTRVNGYLNWITQQTGIAGQ